MFARLWLIAYRDLGRNRRRTGLTLLAITFGLALLIMMSGLIAGVFDSSLSSSITLETGHVQVRAESYEIRKASLEWQDLLENSRDLAAAIGGIEEVTTVAPVLWAAGFLNTANDSVGVRVTGIDPDSGFHDPIRRGIIAGEYLDLNDREGILIGRRMAAEMNLGPGSRVNLLVGTSDGDMDEDIFTVRGVYATGLVVYDTGLVYLPLPKAQALTHAGDRISALILMTRDTTAAGGVAAALNAQDRQVLTWEDMNALILTAIEQGGAAYAFIYGIVILIVAVLIANTLLMSVFERTREFGILAALGMKGRHIMTMILLEAGTLALVGTVLGVLLGSLLVGYLSVNGLNVGDDIASIAEGFAYPSVFYAKFAPESMLTLSLAMLGIVLLAALYPARFAARLEPVDALYTL